MLKEYDQIDHWKKIMVTYESALKQMRARIEILNDEFREVHDYNPIEHIKSRIKSPEGIVKKLQKQGHEVTIENMVEYLNDIAGLRIICSFTSDIYQIANMISQQDDIQVLTVKNYIENPKESGYQSYHMVVTVPVFLTDGRVDTKVEIQIRTIAMDFWASLEHKLYYKFAGRTPKNLSQDLKECADIVRTLDAKMLYLNKQIQDLERHSEVIVPQEESLETEYKAKMLEQEIQRKDKQEVDKVLKRNNPENVK